MALPLPPPGAFGANINAGLNQLMQSMWQQRQMEEQKAMEQSRLRQQMQLAQMSAAAQKAQQDRMYELELQKFDIAKNKKPSPLSTIGKALEDYHRAKESGLSQDEDRAYQDYINKLKTQNKGISATFDPKTGQYSFTLGGQMPPTTASQTEVQKQLLNEKKRQEFSKQFNSTYLTGGYEGSKKLYSDWLAYQNLPDNSPDKARIEKDLTSLGRDYKIAYDIALTNLKNKGANVTNKSVEHEMERITYDFPVGMHHFMNYLMPGKLRPSIRGLYDTGQETAASESARFMQRGYPVEEIEEKQSSPAKSKSIVLTVDPNSLSIEELIKIKQRFK